MFHTHANQFLSSNLWWLLIRKTNLQQLYNGKEKSLDHAKVIVNSLASVCSILPIVHNEDMKINTIISQDRHPIRYRSIQNPFDHCGSLEQKQKTSIKQELCQFSMMKSTRYRKWTIQWSYLSENLIETQQPNYKDSQQVSVLGSDNTWSCHLLGKLAIM
jgi:hypothetical protein